MRSWVLFVKKASKNRGEGQQLQGTQQDCPSLVTPGEEGPQHLLCRLGGMLFTAISFHCCLAIGAWAAESQAVLTFSVESF